MVYYSKRSRADLLRLFKKLLKWSPNKKSYGAFYAYHEVVEYIEDLENQCKTLETLTYRERPRYNDHKKHGKYVLSYQRTPRTTWYFIYDIKPNGDILVKKIMNNHITISGTKK